LEHRLTPIHLPALLAIGAATLPALLAFNVAPSPTLLNQTLAFGLWGGFIALCAATGSAGGRGALRAAAAPLAALVLLAGSAAASMTAGPLPPALGWSAIGSLAAAALMILAGAAVGRDSAVFAAFAAGMACAGAANVLIALVQVFAPGLADGQWVAASAAAGRAVGNLRQPNHVASLLLWSVIATLGLLELRRTTAAPAAALVAALVFGIVLTASRTGMVGVVLLAAWAAVDRRLARRTRAILLSAPVLYAVFWLAMSVWAGASSHEFYGQQRLAEGDLSASRFAIWSDTLALIRAHPWSGVGFGVFNFAWSLSVMPHRPVAFFDHAHNLPLHLAAELGLPLSLGVLALLAAGLVIAVRRSVRDDGDHERAVAGRCATAMVVTIGLHSLLEYPLWYAYFLLPASWAWGFALGGSAGPAPARRVSPAGRRALMLAGVSLSIGAALSVVDYLRVVRIFAPSSVPLEQRIAEGKRSVFFAHHAHYAAATNDAVPSSQLPSFGVSAFYLLDTRLMIAWAKAYAAAGDLDRARHLAARLREFRNRDAASFFAPCEETPAWPPPPFQCEPPSRPLDWTDFIPRRGGG
jgi:O-antigen ligase